MHDSEGSLENTRRGSILRNNRPLTFYSGGNQKKSPPRSPSQAEQTVRDPVRVVLATEPDERRRLRLAVNPSRFLLLPKRSGPPLGSRGLRVTLDRLRADWQTRSTPRTKRPASAPAWPPRNSPHLAGSRPTAQGGGLKTAPPPPGGVAQ